VNIRRLSSLLKELKKIFRKRRKLGLSFIFVIIIACSALLVLLSPEQESSDDPVLRLREKAISAWSVADPEDTEDLRQALSTYLQDYDGERQVDVYTIYVCGEEKRSYGRLGSQIILDLMVQHPRWLVEEYDGDTVTFYEYVEDLSETCKQSAYIGIDGMDQLTLFEGMPSYDHAIRTFFQIDIEQLKTSLPQEAVDSLYNGIRIQDLAQYNSVISTFSQFAIKWEDRAAGILEVDDQAVER